MRQLELQGWRMLHDVHWPGRPKANIDHIAVGPGGGAHHRREELVGRGAPPQRRAVPERLHTET
ncbi:nuclease-related domain-containing protein [Arthrobacter cheniae]|uniref:nuclease-related domain-containing protein n=1 Tax=Arthrobacter cheniae TaxID=1258888 RepID=UPI0038B3DC28